MDEVEGLAWSRRELDVTSLADRPHALYRFFDHDGELLYVGITADPGARWTAHSKNRPWWTDVATVRVEQHPTRAAVFDAERAAIVAERPRHNIHHAQGRMREPKLVEASIGARRVVALRLRDGRCPVGMVDSWADGWIELALYSWVSGYFGHEVRSIAEREVLDAVHAQPMAESAKRAAGEPVNELVWSMDPLARVQTWWEHAHGRRTDDELRLTLETFTGR